MKLLDVSGNALVALYCAAQPIKPEKMGRCMCLEHHHMIFGLHWREGEMTSE